LAIVTDIFCNQLRIYKLEFLAVPVTSPLVERVFSQLGFSQLGFLVKILHVDRCWLLFKTLLFFWRRPCLVYLYLTK